MKQLIEAVNILRIEGAEEVDNAQLLIDLESFNSTGAICLEDQEREDIPLTPAETLTARLAESLENTIRYVLFKFFNISLDFHNFI